MLRFFVHYSFVLAVTGGFGLEGFVHVVFAGGCLFEEFG